MRHPKMLLCLAALVLVLNPVLGQSENSTSSSPLEGVGGYNAACNSTSDCMTSRSLLCLEHICHCAFPQVYDLRLDRCVIPLGKPCDSSDVLKGDAMCPEFGECFLDRCVCKTGYSMHTLTRCKSDLLEVPQERKPIVLWPREAPSSSSSSSSSSNVEEINTPCGNESCDASKGLSCQDGQCKCTDSKELFVEEFGRCLNSTLQRSLREALKLVSTSEDEIKSFVRLLEKFDEVDQHTGNSDHYNSPVHQLLQLLSGGGGGGGRRREDSTTPTTRSQVAPPNRLLYDGDLQHAAQETVTETTVPMSSTDAAATDAEPATEGGEQAQQNNNGGPDQSGVVDPTNGGASVESSGEAGRYQSESGESVKRPEPSSGGDSGIHLDNFNYQGQEPAIVQRQAPPYLQGEGIPLEGIGTIPQNQYRLPIHGGGLGGLGYGGGLGGLGQGGFGQGLGLGGLGLGGHGLGGLGGFRPGFGLGGLGFGRGGQGGGGQGPPPPQGGRGPPPGPPGGGGPPPGGPPQRESLLIDLAEFIGRSLKLMDRFLPLINVINDVFKKEGIFDKKQGLIPGVLRDRRFGEQNQENDELKEGGIMQGVARFIAILMRLKNRLGGDVALKKLLS